MYISLKFILYTVIVLHRATDSGCGESCWLL